MGVPKPQPQVAMKTERGVEIDSYHQSNSREMLIPLGGMDNDNGAKQPYISISNVHDQNTERIQKSDSIIEIRQKHTMQPMSERIQKSTSVVEVVPIRGAINKVSETVNNEQTLHQRGSPYAKTNGNSLHINQAKEQSPLAKTNFRESEVQNSIADTSAKADNFNINNNQLREVSRTREESNNNIKDNLIIPLSPPDSEDQSTPQAPRKLYGLKQTSVESTHSFSENDEL